MAWEPQLGKMFISGIIVLVGIWLFPVWYTLSLAMIGGGIIYAISAGTGVFIGNVPNIIRTGQEGAELFGKGPSKKGK